MTVCTSLLKFFTVFISLTLMGLLPIGVFAQDTDATTTSEEIIAETVLAPTLNYAVEQLPGNEAFGDFVVGPGKTELRLKPGESKTVEIIVTNRMGDFRAFNFEIEDVTGSQDPEAVVVLLGDDRGPYTLKDYIQVPEGGVELKNAERARIPVKITIPKDAEPGGRYGSVLVTTVTKQAEVGNTAGAAPQSALISRIGTLFFVVVDGETEVEGALKEFTTIPKSSWFSGGPIRFGIYFENTGSIHLNPYGEIRITNMLGEEVGFMQIEPWFALPDSLRFREVAWSREFLFGKYTATLNLNRGYNDVIDTETYTFWVLPWKIVAAGFVGVFILVFLMRLFFRSFEFKRKR